MGNNPVITAVTDIDAPPRDVWQVLTDFAAYGDWHPALRFIDVPAEILPGTRLQAQVTLGTQNDGVYEFTVVEYKALEHLAWTGGIPDVLMGLHSFFIELNDGKTHFTESEEFTGAAAVETVEPARAQMEAGSASYVRALKKRVESSY
ncbi:SRPBCC domain-containing protein [Streptomyces phaeochromogenes]|uniref:SRPBCC domain-containing protein n=1 Tax=Streptomyces phaeochromogenes TaxID=1923 RepID=UPI0033FE6CED